MDLVELFAPLGAFVMIVLTVALITRVIATGMLNRTIREAIRAGNPGMVMFLAQRLEARQPWADALLGWIALALAVALVGLGLFEETDADRMACFKAAFVAAVVGATVLLYIRFARPEEPTLPPPVP